MKKIYIYNKKAYFKTKYYVKNIFISFSSIPFI